MTSITVFESGRTQVSGYTLANGRAVLVSVIDAAEGWVTVQACEGQPFNHAHYGTTDQVTIQANQFKPLFSKITDKPRDLLGLALAANKPTWYPGESVWLVGSPTTKRGAYLKNQNGIITLSVIGYKPSLIVYFLNMREGSWEPARNLQSNYKAWAARAQQPAKGIKPLPALEVGR